MSNKNLIWHPGRDLWYHKEGGYYTHHPHRARVVTDAEAAAIVAHRAVVIVPITDDELTAIMATGPVIEQLLARTER